MKEFIVLIELSNGDCIQWVQQATDESVLAKVMNYSLGKMTMTVPRHAKVLPSSDVYQAQTLAVRILCAQVVYYSISAVMPDPYLKKVNSE